MAVRSMLSKENPRPGGRSARVQASVHAAVNALLQEVARTDLAIPMIAERAGVTPSTIYRRWGDLAALLGDVAVSHLKPETEPARTGSARGDLENWVEQYADEMASVPGRQMLRDTLATEDGVKAWACCDFTRQQIAVVAARAKETGEYFPEIEDVIDAVIAPVIYRILFDQPLAADRVRRLVARAMERV